MSKLLSLHNRRRIFRFLTIFTNLNKLDCPEQLTDAFKLGNSVQERTSSKVGQSMFRYAEAKDWNFKPSQADNETLICGMQE